MSSVCTLVCLISSPASTPRASTHVCASQHLRYLSREHCRAALFKTRTEGGGEGVGKEWAPSQQGRRKRAVRGEKR
eukprot:2837412-Rhodomonas_salina.1